MTRPDWFSDWTGEACAIIASGPSVKLTDVSVLKDRLRVIAIKENVQLCPWADVVYGCDAAWWRNVDGLPDYRGLKVTATPRLHEKFPDVHLAQITDPSCDALMLSKPGVIGSGGNSGFQALNLAVQFGAARILLIGFDMSDANGTHWYGPAEGKGRSNPGEWNFRRWRAAFGTASGQLKLAGVQVLNVSEQSALTCFPKLPLDQALAEWKI